MNRLIYLAVGLSLITIIGSSKAEDDLNIFPESPAITSQDETKEDSKTKKQILEQRSENVERSEAEKDLDNRNNNTQSSETNSQVDADGQEVRQTDEGTSDSSSRPLEQEVNQIDEGKSDSSSWALLNPLLVAGDKGLFGLLALLAVIFSSWRNTNSTKKSMRGIEKRLISLKSHIKEIDEPGKDNINAHLINAKLEGLDSKVKIIENKLKQISEPISRDAMTSISMPNPPTPLPQTPQVFKPQGPSKEQLVQALNSGERQKLKDESISQLNITSKSENDILIGRSTVTELEVVSAGGSYQLLIISGQSLLFPTEQTLKGFTAAQKSKGIFDYEEQSISTPELAEPALVEKSGSDWHVKQLGKIYIPKT